jgi:tRNA(Ile)-lysidine synthase
MATPTKNKVDIWVACSGGLDSVVLAHLLNNTSKKIGLLHANFQLRGQDSEKDEQFVVTLAKRLNIPVEVKRFQITQNKNTQLQARDFRYKWFQAIAERDDACIALGHHLDDQIETFFLQLERGAGWSGMRAMPRINGVFIRPLLHLEKQELANLAIANGWSWREDASNEKTDYRRNYWRLKLLPQLYENGLKKQQLISLIGKIQRLHDLTLPYLPSLREHAWNWVLVKHWLMLPEIFWQFFLHDFNLPKAAVKRVNELCSASTGAHYTFGHWQVHKDRDKLWWIHEQTISAEKLRVHCEIRQEEPIVLKDKALYLDADKIQGAISFTNWQKGDQFVPYGKVKPKLLSDCFVNWKVPNFMKPMLPVLQDDKGIIAVGVYEIADRVKVTSATKKVMEITWVENLLTSANNIFDRD